MVATEMMLVRFMLKIWLICAGWLVMMGGIAGDGRGRTAESLEKLGSKKMRQEESRRFELLGKIGTR